MTDEERSEVAAELRELAEDYEKVPAWDVIAAGELPAPVDDVFMACGLGRAVHATEICGRLADLIEPEERTCRIIERTELGPTSRGKVRRCSACGKPLPKWLFRDGRTPAYCLKCGARVIQE